MALRPVLMILTSHRQDCLQLCLNCLEWFTDIRRFKIVYILANEVDSGHNDVIQQFKSRHPNVLDIHAAPKARGYNPALLAMENLVLARHQEDVIVKIDEDVFVTPGWLDGLLDAYRRHRSSHLLISATVPNNQIGKVCLTPFLKQAFPDEFQGAVTEDPVHLNTLYGAWAWDKVLRCGLPHRFLLSPLRMDVRMEGFLNINCILFDRRLTQLIRPLVRNDEYEINHAMKRHRLSGVMDSRTMVHHYAFYRQEGLDAIVPLGVVARYMASLWTRRAIPAPVSERQAA